MGTAAANGNVKREAEPRPPAVFKAGANAGGINGRVGGLKRPTVTAPVDNAVILGHEPAKKRKDDFHVVLPIGFLNPLPQQEWPPVSSPRSHVPVVHPAAATSRQARQFWKAGDYEGGFVQTSSASLHAGLDHLRVHPRFLHSNATSHKWALGAFAELLDNSLDEVRNGATYVNVDVIENEKDKSKMLLIEDDGGGMDPNKMRQCMSLGYSAKCKIANTIGQYGNGFKTSTMRLGADVIVFTRSRQNDGKRRTQSIGLLSYTFLSSTRKEDIVVPIVDYENKGNGWEKLRRTSSVYLQTNIETIVQWSPFLDEDDLLQQFTSIKDQGTRIIIYNLWEGDQGGLELDFIADLHDIRIRDVIPDEKKTQMAYQFPTSRHFLTYQHSLRSYASILYLKIPTGFKMFLRGKEVLHHNLVDDMMHTDVLTYRPQSGDGVCKDPKMAALVTMGFVKDAKHHIDIQGFNVYHKNRLIKPFWRVWNAAGSDGRGVIGVLEADFVEPTHNKQGFERTTILQRLENRLVDYQKTYWSKYCHKIGYAPRRGVKKVSCFGVKEDEVEEIYCQRQDKYGAANPPERAHQDVDTVTRYGNETSRYDGGEKRLKLLKEENIELTRYGNETSRYDGEEKSLKQLKEENIELKSRLKKMEESVVLDLKTQGDRKKFLEDKVQELEQQLDEANKEQEALIDIFSEERNRRDAEEMHLRERLKDASHTIQKLLRKVGP